MLSRLQKKKAENPTERTGTVQTASLRIERDLENLLGTTAKVEIPDKQNLLVLGVSYQPPDGVWKGGLFQFRITFTEEYPHVAPKVYYLGPNRIWHPNIEGDADKSEWGVCLNILRKDWTPVLGLREILFGLEMMFFEPNIDDPLPGTAKLAAQMLKDNAQEFRAKAKRWMAQNYV